MHQENIPDGIVTELKFSSLFEIEHGNRRPIPKAIYDETL